VILLRAWCKSGFLIDFNVGKCKFREDPL